MISKNIMKIKPIFNYFKSQGVRNSKKNAFFCVISLFYNEFYSKNIFHISNNIYFEKQGFLSYFVTKILKPNIWKWIAAWNITNRQKNGCAKNRPSSLNQIRDSYFHWEVSHPKGGKICGLSSKPPDTYQFMELRIFTGIHALLS